MKRTLAQRLKDDFFTVYQRNYNSHSSGTRATDALAKGKRALKTVTLSYLSDLVPVASSSTATTAGVTARDVDEIVRLCVRQFSEARNMTDQLGALVCLTNTQTKERGECTIIAPLLSLTCTHILPLAPITLSLPGSLFSPFPTEDALQQFWSQWKHDELVMNKWFGVQATSPFATLGDIQRLLQHPSFNINNPNKVYSLIVCLASSC